MYCYNAYKTQHRNKMYCYLCTLQNPTWPVAIVSIHYAVRRRYIYIYIYYRQSNIVRVPPCAAMEPVQVVAAASAAVRLRV